MKQFKALSTLLLLCMMIFTSCTTESQDIAYYLNGTWAGYVDDGGKRYDVNMSFIQDGGNYYATSGYGYENSRWSYLHTLKTRFRWYVEGKRIHLHYDDDVRVIVDYTQLPGSYNRGERFSGYFIDKRTGNELARFYLIKIE